MILAIAALSSAGLTSLVWTTLWRRTIGEHDTRQWKVTETRLDILWTERDHYYRLATRVDRDTIGDLLDRIGVLTDRVDLLDGALKAKNQVVEALTGETEALAQVIELDQPRHLHRGPYADFTYGRTA